MLQRLARRAGAETPAPPEPAVTPLRRTLGARPDAERSPITDVLYGRLSPDTRAAISERIEPGLRPVWDGSSPQERRRIALSFGLMYDVPGVAAETGLSAATPPREVHSMVHGWTTEVGGSYYLADMVYYSLREIGAAPSAGSRVLDFSCSSGRVVRPLIAALPEVRWHGCDPNAGAVDWMRAEVGGIALQTSPIAPPLPYGDAEFDAVFAISVWSHYSAQGALTWLEELRRVVAPGGHALITTHGLQACVWFTVNEDPAIAAKLGPDWIERTRTRLDDDGHCFWDVFGDTGDWGVVDADWGLAFFTPEWLLEQITPAWSLCSYRIGGAHGNQDVYVLQRR